MGSNPGYLLNSFLFYLEKLHLVKMRFDWSPHLGTSAGSGSVCWAVNELAMYCADVAPVIKIGQG